jgi:cytochrome c oxidase subunit 2
MFIHCFERRLAICLNKRAGILVSAALLLGGCAAPSALRPQGPAAERIAELWWVMFGLASVIYVVVMALLLLALFRRGRVERAGERRSWIVGGGVIMPVVVLLITFAFTLGTLAALAGPPRDALTVEVVGRQWWWEVRYPAQEVVTANEIHIPAGQQVRLVLTSPDVIHSFWVPELHGKIDLIPGKRNEFWIEARYPGTYRGLCAEYCGTQHAKMQFLVIAELPDRFATWLDEQRQPAAVPADPQAEHGQQVFLGAACVQCHTIRGTNATGNLGPDLTHVASRETLAAASVPNTRGHLAGWVADPQSIKPGSKMPSANLSGEELRALVDYLATLK